MAPEVTSTSNLPWTWVLGALLCSRKVDTPLIIDIVKRAPEITDELEKNVKEMITLRILEDLSNEENQTKKDDTPAHAPGQTEEVSSNGTEDIVQHILAEMSAGNPEVVRSNVLNRDVQSFIEYKRTSLPMCSLQKIKDAILEGGSSVLESLRERSRLSVRSQCHNHTDVTHGYFDCPDQELGGCSREIFGNRQEEYHSDLPERNLAPACTSTATIPGEHKGKQISNFQTGNDGGSNKDLKLDSNMTSGGVAQYSNGSPSYSTSTNASDGMMQYNGIDSFCLQNEVEVGSSTPQDQDGGFGENSVDTNLLLSTRNMAENLVDDFDSSAEVGKGFKPDINVTGENLVLTPISSSINGTVLLDMVAKDIPTGKCKIVKATPVEPSQSPHDSEMQNAEQQQCSPSRDADNHLASLPEVEVDKNQMAELPTLLNGKKDGVVRGNGHRGNIEPSQSPHDSEMQNAEQQQSSPGRDADDHLASLPEVEVDKNQMVELPTLLNGKKDGVVRGNGHRGNLEPSQSPHDSELQIAEQEQQRSPSRDADDHLASLPEVEVDKNQMAELPALLNGKKDGVVRGNGHRGNLEPSQSPHDSEMQNAEQEQQRSPSRDADDHLASLPEVEVDKNQMAELPALLNGKKDGVVRGNGHRGNLEPSQSPHDSEMQNAEQQQCSPSRDADDHLASLPEVEVDKNQMAELPILLNGKKDGVVRGNGHLGNLEPSQSPHDSEMQNAEQQQRSPSRDADDHLASMPEVEVDKNQMAELPTLLNGRKDGVVRGNGHRGNLEPEKLNYVSSVERGKDIFRKHPANANGFRPFGDNFPRNVLNGDESSDDITSSSDLEITSDGDEHGDGRICGSLEKDPLLSLYGTYSQESFATQPMSCIKCNGDGELLVCSSSSCQLVVHQSCLRSVATFDENGKFLCPFCAYARSISQCLELKKKAALARKNLAMFIGGQPDSQPKKSTLTSEGVENGKSKGIGRVDFGKERSVGEGSGTKALKSHPLGHRENGNQADPPKSNLLDGKKWFSPRSAKRKLYAEEDEDVYNVASRHSKKRAGNSIKHSTDSAIPHIRRIPMPWSKVEEEKLKEGMQKLTSVNSTTVPWSSILSYGADTFLSGRTPTDLRDKWRNMCKVRPTRKK